MGFGKFNEDFKKKINNANKQEIEELKQRIRKLEERLTAIEEKLKD